MHECQLYLNDWCGGSLQTLKEHFGITDEELAGIEILLASYNVDDYQGEAFVLFREEGILYEVNACHDALDDMHGQWEPEDTLIGALRHRMENGRLGAGRGGVNLFADELRFLLLELELNTIHASGGARC